MLASRRNVVVASRKSELVILKLNYAAGLTILDSLLASAVCSNQAASSIKRSRNQVCFCFIRLKVKKNPLPTDMRNISQSRHRIVRFVDDAFLVRKMHYLSAYLKDSHKAVSTVIHGE
ncbi:hypothetical protein T4D_16875 [Trichinella pseudospiralis]|uniref:Uncharacterized protein n=1 Tax=Trichinella pseudospiralis TaxID=6337 RepID=A0A0V1FR20_TRIPS|nr:hypothetical protein T4D_16875 [Trichinella pseudospiralis]